MGGGSPWRWWCRSQKAREGFSTVIESVTWGWTCERSLRTEGSDKVVAGRSSVHLSG